MHHIYNNSFKIIALQMNNNKFSKMLLEYKYRYKNRKAYTYSLYS
ncbi:hypothetical protein [uncultured Brachyspira sp.]|nr:hypothetical protein [uncultured Brachyspira sp.]